MINFCGVKCYDAEVYCDTSNGGGGWLVGICDTAHIEYYASLQLNC